MSSTEKPFQVVVDGKVYTVVYVVVTLRASKKQRVPYVVTDRALITESEVVENTQNPLSLDWQVRVAKAAVRQLDISFAEAAQLVGSIKAMAEGLTRVQRRTVTRLIRTALEDDVTG